MKRISLIGSTGSIGENTLNVARHLGPGEIEVAALGTFSNIDKLEAQAREFDPALLAVYDKDKAHELQRRLPRKKVLGGIEGLEAVAAFEGADFAVSALTGTLGLRPTLAALNSGKNVGLANKESLISGGALVMEIAKRKGVKIIPIDSEHSAIFQCLHGENAKDVSRIIVTASGGPFREWTKERADHATVDEALAHPSWKMGPKITIDSSTLMNKGLEVIEASHLFGKSIDQIDVVIHPQSVIHSMVEFVDGSMLAQMSVPTMVVPIQYALTYPRRLHGMMAPFDFVKNSKLEFFQPDLKKFRCLALAFEAVRAGGSLACYMNAANEVLVHRFLDKQISWGDIAAKLEVLMGRHSVQPVDKIEDVYAIDADARQEAQTF